MESSDAVTARIEEEAGRLDTFFDRITSCRVVVEAPHRHHKWGELFHICIELDVPGARLVVNHEPSSHAALSHDDTAALTKHLEVHPEHRDIYVAIRDAFDGARRRLQEHVKRMRSIAKTHPQRLRQGFDTPGP